MNEGGIPEFRLDQWHLIRLQFLWVYERALDMDDSWQTADYDLQSVLWVRCGWVEAGPSRASAIRVVAGEWLVLSQGVRWQRFSSDCVLFSVGFRFQLPTGEAVLHENLPVRIAEVDSDRLKRAARRLARAASRTIGLGYGISDRTIPIGDLLGSQQAFWKFFLTLLDELERRGVRSRRMSDAPPAVAAALDLIESHPAGKRIDLEAVASQSGFSLPHLDRLMVLKTGKTLHKQFEARRLNEARDALRIPTIPLKSIAYSLGFSSCPHFHTWFKKKEGVTPGTFRKRAVRNPTG